MSRYDIPCEYCDGTVRERIVDREPINHHRGIVILENVPIGICDHCGAHYYAADVLRRAEAVLKSDNGAQRTMQVPIELF